MLEREDISGLDLNGNYLIQTKEMAAIRLDRENRFTESQPIKKIFSGNSSLVGRLLLLEKRRFDSVNEVFAAIGEWGGSLSLSSVSKVLKGLEEELIIEKSREGIALLQPDKLLQRLQEEYRPPKVLARLRLKLPETALEIRDALREALPESARWTLTGESSAQQYTVTTQPSEFNIYATGFGSLARYEADRFANATVQRTEDSFPYFGRPKQAGFPWSSELQCYLELSRLGKRERELADTIRGSILNRFR